MQFRVDDQGLLPFERDEKAVRYLKSRRGRVVDLQEKGHSSQHAALIFSFLDWLYREYGHGNYESREAMRYHISVLAGHVSIEMRITKDGDAVKVLEAKSWSQPECSQDEFNKLSKAVEDFALDRFGITLEGWQKNT